MYRISLVNHADPQNADHWEPCRSKRRARAVEQTRKIMSGAEPLFRNNKRVKTGNVMLFHVLPDGSMRPVSLKAKAIRVQEGAQPVGAR